MLGVLLGEKLWRMPLTESLRKKIESPIADIKNYAGMLAWQ